MGESFYSDRFGKNVWLTIHAIEALAKRNITLPVVKRLIEFGHYKSVESNSAWIYYDFPECEDNLVYAAVVDDKAIIIKTI